MAANEWGVLIPEEITGRLRRGGSKMSQGLRSLLSQFGSRRGGDKRAYTYSRNIKGAKHQLVLTLMTHLPVFWGCGGHEVA